MLTRSGRFTNILLSSTDRVDSNEAPTNCIIRMQPPLNLTQTKSVNLVNFNFQPGVPIINSLYNKLVIEDSVLGVRTVTIPDGYYNVIALNLGFLGLAMNTAINAAFASPGRYFCSYDTLSQKMIIENTAMDTFRLLWASATVEKSSLISYALGYGDPFNLADTAFATTQTPPGPANLGYPATYRIILEPLPTGAVRTTNGQPATFVLSSGIFTRNITFFNNSATAMLIKTGEMSGIGSISEFRVRIETAVDYPPYPLDQSLNEWTMILTAEE